MQLPHRPPARPLVLVVDDDHDARATRANALTGMLFDVLIVDGVVKARTRASKMRPDIVVVGVASRGGSGWVLLRTLKRDPRTRDIPVVAVAVEATPAVRARSRREGCAALCLTSCPPDRLAFGLRNVLERRSQADRERVGHRLRDSLDGHRAVGPPSPSANDSE